MAEGYGSTSQGLEYKSVVMGFLYRLSDATSHRMPFDNVTDAFWAMINPFLDEYDHERWRKACTPKQNTNEEQYQISVNKVQLVSMVLYRTGVLPNRDGLQNRKYQIVTATSKVERGGLKTHLLSDVQLKQFLMRHLMLLAYIAKAMQSYAVHMDILWAVLSPYVTIEDYELWQSNNTTFGNPKNPLMYNDYRWNVEKIRICMGVMERADFLWQTGITDEPEDFADKEGQLGVRPT